MNKHRHNLNDTEVSSYSCAVCNGPDHDDVAMVGCDNCSKWFHFKCVGVSADVKEVSWSCINCKEKDMDQSNGRKSADSGQNEPAGARAKEPEAEAKDISAEVDELERELQQLEQTRKLELRKMELEKAVFRRRLEVQRELAEQRQKVEREKRQMELEAEKEHLQKAIADEEAYRKEQQAMRSEMQSKLDQLRIKRHSDKVKAICGPDKNTASKAAGEGSGTTSGQPRNYRESCQKHSTPKGIGSIPEMSHTRVDYVSNNETTSESEDDNVSEISQTSISKGPTKAQLSARQFLSRKLPVFTGHPEDWPMFISSFETANEACGFSNVENLARLQESLKGQALEAVRSRLLLPKAVPQIIETLRMLYGRPEQLLNMLLVKVRKADPPRADRLSSFIGYGMVVQQLVDHLDATNMRDHLFNPMLIQELVEKLPAGTKMEWVRYKRNASGVTLRTLADFLSEIVRDASEATMFTEGASVPDNHSKKGKAREGYLHAHRMSPEEEEQRNQTNAKKPCRVCNRVDHRIRNCDQFRKLSWENRWEVVYKWKLCKNCLNEHGDSRCKLNFRCNVERCGEAHHPLLHPEEVLSDCNVHGIQHQTVIFRMIPVTIYNGKSAVNAVAFLDEGSSYTLVETSLVNQLQIEGVTQPLRVTWTAGVSRVEKDSQIIDLSISARNSTKRFNIHKAHTVQELKLPKQTLGFKIMADEYPHLRNLPVVDYKQAVPQILIGLKDLHLYAPLETRMGKPGEPIAVKSKLGWTVYGPIFANIHERNFIGNHLCEGISNQELHDLLREHYVMEESGITVAFLPESADDQRARKIMENTTVNVGERYETGLLWKTDERCLPDSYPMALKRFKSLEKRLLKDETLYEKVRNLIADYVMKGYAHKATVRELYDSKPEHVWYLPLNVVVNPKKPEKIRLVWDAAATVDGISLNSQLLKGPDMLTSLPSVICRFREREVGFGGDIREMYHQLLIRKEDKQYQRFLYRNDAESRIEVYVMDVATFGATCSPCSAQFVKNKNANELAAKYPEAAVAIVDNHYVDDYFDSADTVGEAIQRAKEVRYVHSRGGFEIRNWVASCDEILQSLGEPKAGRQVHFSQDKDTGTERVLGMIWSTDKDEFTFSTKLRDELMPFLCGERRPTKRIVLSCVMSLFDPLGLLAPFTVYGKILIQDLWRSGTEWDENIDDDCLKKWKNWIGRLPEVEAIRVPRYHFTKGLEIDFRTLQLHVFVDASEHAYGSAAYFRVLVAGKPVCSLVMAKSKVAPLKQLTIPRLELQAAVLGARLMNSVIDTHSLAITECFIWSDSRTVLSWIHSDQRKYKQFVAFRIGEIHSLTKLCQWRWVPTKFNVADEVTKWQAGRKFESKSTWFNGPIFLHQPETEWPEQTPIIANVLEEIRAVHLFHDVSMLEALVNPERISRWKVLVRATACVFRFISNCRLKVKGLQIETIPASDNIRKLVRKKLSSMTVPLKREEYQRAEAYLWKIAQTDAFGEDMKVLLKNQQLSCEKHYSLDKSSYLYDKSPFLDEQGVIRMEGRTKNGEFIPFELRFPVILPRAHPITTKLLEHYHQKLGHANTETVVNELRQRFFISYLRAELKRITRMCIQCKLNKSKPVVPRMAPLPVQRFTPYKRPFSYTGVDYFGPVTVTVDSIIHMPHYAGCASRGSSQFNGTGLPDGDQAVHVSQRSPT